MALARRMGRALASLGASRVSPPAVLTARSLVPRAARLAAELVRRVPELEPDAARLLGWLHRELAKPRARPLVPVHGSPHPGQWLYEGPGVGLVDFAISFVVLHWSRLARLMKRLMRTSQFRMAETNTTELEQLVDC